MPIVRAVVWGAAYVVAAVRLGCKTLRGEWPDAEAVERLWDERVDA